MPREFSRNVRVGDQIQRNLAQLIQTEIADPRVGLVNVNDVDVSRDYSNAKIYVTFIDGGSEQEWQESVAALNKAAGYLRTLLAKTLNSRTTPRLIFVLDKTALEGQRLDQLIDRALDADREQHAASDHDDTEK